jgi:hypothetical protein
MEELFYCYIITKISLIILSLIILIFKFKKPEIQIKELEDNIIELLPSIKFDGVKKKTNNLYNIFNSRELFINELNITNKYIQYIRPVVEKKKEINGKDIYINERYINIFKRREEESKEYAKLCMEEKLIEPIKNNSNIIYDIPLISVILPIFNKEKVLMKSIRSIQNQSFKNIEIIIVDDCSGDNIKILYDELLKTDQRIRIFYHLKNMGVWRTRIDGILYSRGKYIIHFDTGDLYSDKYALKDSFELAEKYGLDSIRMLFKKIDNYNDNNQRIAEFPIIIFLSRSLMKYD